MTLARRSAATAAGLLASRVAPEVPDHLHPVARFGQRMTEVEEHLWRDDHRAGVAYAGVGVVLGAFAGRASPSTALTVAVCAAGAQLRQAASTVAGRLETGDLDGAREALSSLVGRDTSALDDRGIAAAAVESVAENMVDAVFAPAFWSVVAGSPGAAVHRAVNTMDAMVGRRNARFGRFGWASARLDDALNWAPARLFAATLAAAHPDQRERVLATVRADAPAHPSPNAGVAEAAMAAVLGCQLGGPLRYGDVVEDRPLLGVGPRPTVTELREAIRVAAQAELLLVAGLAAGIVLTMRPRSRRRTPRRGRR